MMMRVIALQVMAAHRPSVANLVKLQVGAGLGGNPAAGDPQPASDSEA